MRFLAQLVIGFVRSLARLVIGLVKLTLLGALVAGGALAAYVAWEASQQDAADTSASERFDYNGPLPGCGFPWIHGVYAAGQDSSGWIGFAPPPPDFQAMPGEFDLKPFDGINFPDTWLPVALGEDDRPLNWDDVYRLVFAVHPDLGGSGVHPASEADREGHRAAQNWKGDHWYVGESGGGDLYYLTPIPNETLERLATSDSGCTSPAIAAPTTKQTTTTTKPETQRWQVAISGYEIDLMERYWRRTTQVRAAIRFDYTMQAEFTLRKEDGKWIFDSGTITYAELGLSEEYWPEKSWELDWPVSCTKCDITYPRSLTGQVIGNEVRLNWGTFRPEVKVNAKIIAPCTPMPGCAEWKNRIFTSSGYFQRINGELLNLAEGATLAPPVVDPASGLQWLDYTIALRGRQ